MKPLELTVYPPLDAVTNRYIEGCRAGGYEPMFHIMPPGLLEARAKRFTDAELAAEFHASCMDTRVSGDRSRNYPREDLLRDEYIRRLNQEFTLHRFATLPHYDEVTA